MELRNCGHCKQEISATAFFCPACRKSDDAAQNWLQTVKTTAKWAFVAGLVLVGPNAIAGAILGPEMNRPKAKAVRRFVQKLEAIDSVPLNQDVFVFFSKKGFVHMFLYDLGRNPEIPAEIPYADFLGVRILEFSPRRILGQIEYKTPSTRKPSAKPKPRERLLLGKELYAQLVADAEEYERNGAPDKLCYDFEFEGEFAEARTRLVETKFDEYARP